MRIPTRSHMRQAGVQMKNDDAPITNDNTSIKRIGGYLHRVIPITDVTGKVLSHFLKPVMVEFRPRDLMQVVVGAYYPSIPMKSDIRMSGMFN